MNAASKVCIREQATPIVPCAGRPYPDRQDPTLELRGASWRASRKRPEVSGRHSLMSDNTAVYAGAMPSRQGELALEMHGMAPIPAENWYGSIHRIFTVWFTPNLVPAAFFVGVLALNLGFALGTAAIVIGTVLGALLVSTMCSWGPSTGLGQLPLARLQFGRTVFVPGLLMWL